VGSLKVDWGCTRQGFWGATVSGESGGRDPRIIRGVLGAAAPQDEAGAEVSQDRTGVEGTGAPQRIRGGLPPPEIRLQVSWSTLRGWDMDGW
jgi:hypothetical protein